MLLTWQIRTVAPHPNPCEMTKIPVSPFSIFSLLPLSPPSDLGPHSASRLPRILAPLPQQHPNHLKPPHSTDSTKQTRQRCSPLLQNLAYIRLRQSFHSMLSEQWQWPEMQEHTILLLQKNGGVILKEEDVAVTNIKIDLTRGSQNPLQSINFFQDYDSKEKFLIHDDRISHLLPTSYQDFIVRVYSKKPELVGQIAEAFENFQLKTYGIKAQVCPTPERKKRPRDF